MSDNTELSFDEVVLCIWDWAGGFVEVAGGYDGTRFPTILAAGELSARHDLQFQGVPMMEGLCTFMIGDEPGILISLSQDAFLRAWLSATDETETLIVDEGPLRFTMKRQPAAEGP